MTTTCRFLAALTWTLLASCVNAEEPPIVPVGLDAYRQWDHWAYQRIGVRAYMRSTYDRAGGNEGADASHFLYQLADDNNVTLDVEGPGILCFARYNHWHGSPWRYVVDGTQAVVAEGSTPHPGKPLKDSTFIPGDLFPPPLALTWSATQGADLLWTPIPFEKSFRMGYSRTRYGTGYYIYQQFVRGARISRPLEAWDGKTPPAKDVLDLVNRSGADIAPPVGTAGMQQVQGDSVLLGRGKTVELGTIVPRGSATVRALELSAPRAQAIALGGARLKLTWDGQSAPSVDAPLALFFGAGTLYNRESREYLVKAFPVSVRFDAQRVRLACYFPMPFFKSAKVELVGGDSEDVSEISWKVRYQPLADPPSHVGYFHATYRDHGRPVRGHDLVLLDTRETEGGGDWSGQLVGTSLIFSDRAALGTLEGDPRFFFDDSQTPQAQGTGTEEWCGGGDYWGGVNMTLPFAGHPTGARDAKASVCELDKIESAYRFLLGDLMPFGKNALICLEHGGVDESTEHYQTVTYWYGRHVASVVKTDELKIGDAASETAHGYVSPLASAPYAITSRYEWGVDSGPGTEKGFARVEFYPSHTDKGRKTVGTSEFNLKLDPNNLGVMLRRKLDYAFPNQRAEVSISDEKGLEWKPAGIWYLAGSNTCVYSNPKDELGATQHIVETSNRRFRDDEFLLPRDLTQGRTAIGVRVKFTPVNIPLFPGRPVDEQAWSELRYDAFCFMLQ